jgi:ATP-dependent DNA ligase
VPVPPPVALARATEALRPASVREPCWEPKWDGWRAAYVGGRLWSRRGTELTRYFPDLVPVMRDRLPTDTCVDGELVVWAIAAGRLNFAALSRRIVAGHRVAAVAIHHPAHFVAFDLLAVGGTDLRRRPLATRREQLEQLMFGLAAPLAVCEQTTEEAVARRWLETLGAAGVEGVVVKDRAAAYPDAAGMRCWYKVKIRNSLDAVAVGTVGDPAAPTALLLACPTADGLQPMETTTALPRATARDVGRHLVVDPQARPPRVSWPGRDVFEGALTGIEPVVVEVRADVAIDNGVLRHAARLVRLRLDLSVEDLCRDLGWPRPQGRRTRAVPRRPGARGDEGA